MWSGAISFVVSGKILSVDCAINIVVTMNNLASNANKKTHISVQSRFILWNNKKSDFDKCLLIFTNTFIIDNQCLNFIIFLTRDRAVTIKSTLISLGQNFVENFSTGTAKKFLTGTPGTRTLTLWHVPPSCETRRGGGGTEYLKNWYYNSSWFTPKVFFKIHLSYFSFTFSPGVVYFGSFPTHQELLWLLLTGVSTGLGRVWPGVRYIVDLYLNLDHYALI